MKTQLFKAFAVLILGLATQSSVFALGSYMFCVNKNNSHDWKWAPPQSKPPLEGYEDIVPGDKNGTWIYGIGDTYPYLHPILSLAYYQSYYEKYPQGKSDAQNFCSALQKICTDKYGPDYSHIGVSGHAVPEASWSYICLYYRVNPDDRWSPYDRYTCPNWNYPEGDNG